MNCQRIEGVITDLARDQMVEASVRDEALEHCEACASCARTLAEQRALTTALRSLANKWEAVDAPQMIQQSLTAALRNQTTRPNASEHEYRWQYWASAIAAILLIFFAIGAFRWQQQPVKSSKSEAVQAAVPPTKTTTSPTPTVRHEDQQKPVPRRSDVSNKRGSRVPRRENQGRAQSISTTTVDKYGSSEIATEFLPLGDGYALSLQDGGQIVRVEVPRSTLVSFGLPVNMDRVGHRVKADLLLGVDGSARAIRFVQ